MVLGGVADVVWFCYKLPINGRDAMRWVSFAFCFALLLIHTDIHTQTSVDLCVCICTYTIVLRLNTEFFLSTSHPRGVCLIFGTLLFFLLCCQFAFVLPVTLQWFSERHFVLDCSALHSNAAKPGSSFIGALLSDPVKRRAKFVAVFVVFLVVLAIGFCQNKYKMQRCKFSSF